MVRRLLLGAAFAALASTGCLSRCGERHGLFTSHTRSEAPCQTVGRGGGCFDAATGQPVPCPPGAPSVLPGGVPMTGPGAPGGFEVGPMPAPSDLIRPPAVPIPAPPPMTAPGGSDALLPLPTGPGTPVRGGQK